MRATRVIDIRRREVVVLGTHSFRERQRGRGSLRGVPKANPDRESIEIESHGMKGIPEDILAAYHGKDEDWPAKMVKEEAPTDGLDRPKTFGFGFPPESTYGAIYKEWACSAQGSKNLPSSLPGVTALDSSTALKGLADSDFNTRTNDQKQSRSTKWGINLCIKVEGCCSFYSKQSRTGSSFTGNKD